MSAITMVELFVFRSIFLFLWFAILGILILIIGLWVHKRFVKANEFGPADLHLFTRFFVGLSVLLGLSLMCIFTWYLKYEPDDFLVNGTMEYKLEELNGTYTLMSDEDSWNGLGLKIELIDQNGLFSFEYNVVGKLATPEAGEGIIDPFINMIEFHDDTLGRGKIVKTKAKVIKLKFPQIEFQKL